MFFVNFGSKFSAYWWSRVGALFLRLGHLLLFVPHTGFLYADDWLWIFDSGAGPMLSVVFLDLFLYSFGVLISWKKVQLNARVDWFGLVLALRYRIWEIPEEKRKRSLAFLKLILGDQKKFIRKKIEAGVGLLVWESELAFVLRPWLFGMYCILTQPSNTMISASRSGVLSLVSGLSDKLVGLNNPSSLDVKPGWKVLSIGGVVVQTKQDVLNSPLSESRNSWIRLHNPRSKNVRSHPAAKLSALMWSRALSFGPLCYSFRFRHDDSGEGYADAFANAEVAGIGGYFSATSPSERSTRFWFQMEIRHSDLPSAWKWDTNLQKCIAGFEMLAQTALFVLRALHLRPCSRVVEFRHDSDNISVESVGNKLFTMNCQPAPVTSNFALWLHFFRIRPSLRHVEGVRNIIADGFSRFDKNVMATVDPGNRLDFCLVDLLVNRFQFDSYPLGRDVTPALERLRINIASRNDLDL